MELGECLNIFLNSSHNIFDRGKEFKHMTGTSRFAMCDSLFWFNLDKFFEENAQENGYWSFTWFRDKISRMLANGRVSSTAWMMFVKILLMNIVGCEKANCINHKLLTVKSSHSCFNFSDKVFDRGKTVQLIEGYFYSAGDYEGYLPTTTPCMIILTGSILMDAYNSDSVSNFLQYGLSYEISVHSLGSLVVTQIHLGSFDCLFEFIMFNTLIILHHGFLYLQPWVFFHVALWFHKSQGNWFYQIARTCALVRKISAQLIRFDSSAGN
ncbi:uncharacterized protein LOC113308837 [Papaver somniferum]|uniref:uncharacterized protein LOC113308837 n=1 Tax=Papaver somniferum TaxID=3469 RepID=UPI000E6F8CAE|nr:uncharacterized protein LOC113308837 [Papaver somniferum]